VVAGAGKSSPPAADVELLLLLLLLLPGSGSTVSLVAALVAAAPASCGRDAGWAAPPSSAMHTEGKRGGLRKARHTRLLPPGAPAHHVACLALR
jgi:hypothetical protein